MSDQDAFARILASLYQATLDDRHWPVTSALIDEACGITGNCLLVGEGPPDDIRAMFVGVYARGERQADLEREYLQVYHPIDEAVPRLRQLPDSQVVPIADLYTAEDAPTGLRRALRGRVGTRRAREDRAGERQKAPHQVQPLDRIAWGHRVDDGAALHLQIVDQDPPALPVDERG